MSLFYLQISFIFFHLFILLRIIFHCRLLNFFQIFDETFPDSKNQSKEGFIIMTSCTHPHSRGVMYLKSSLPEIHPHIDPRYLSYKKDSRCYINGEKGYIFQNYFKLFY